MRLENNLAQFVLDTEIKLFRLGDLGKIIHNTKASTLVSHSRNSIPILHASSVEADRSNNTQRSIGCSKLGFDSDCDLKGT